VGCEKCDTTGTRCTECDHDGNWDLINGKCTCRSGYYSNVTLSICFPCANLDPSCTSCSETPVYECLACSTGFYPINTTCLPCSTDLVGCSECDTTGTRCTECDHDGNWVLRSGQCICRSGYYSNETSGVCIPCTNLDPLCTSCSQAASVYACLSCSHGYLPSNSSCLPCDSYLPGCSECDVTGTVCTECDHHGHWDLRNGKCSC
jgi:proprotein convertase subtilisin/kexin type 5